MKFLIFLFALFVSSKAQSISCGYIDHYEFGYTCNLLIFNSAGWNNFTSINGTHLEGRSDADVLAVNIYDGETANFPHIICNTFPNVEYIDMAIAFMNRLAEDDFLACPNLIFLNLWQNYIAEVPENIFVNNPRLLYVDFDMNRLTTVGENTFNHLVDLEYLVLRNNPFQDIPAGTFRNLRNLTNLYLDNCRITELKPEWFVDLIGLRYLELFYNEIKVIPHGIFRNLGNVRILDIAMNPFEYLSYDTFHAFTNLRSLYMDNCFLTEFHPQWFDQLVSLENLILYNNLFPGLPENAFANLVNLQFLRLDNNPVGDMPPGIFNTLERLHTIYLTSAGIQNVSPQWFANTPDLSTIYLGYNQIQEIPEGTFANLRNLTILGLYSNQLKVLRRNSFGPLGGLWWFHMDYNAINGLDIEFFNEATNLDRFYFYQNICASGTFMWFIEYRDRGIELMSRCFSNYRYIIDTVTEADNTFRIFDTLDPGLAIRVDAPQDVQIALLPIPQIVPEPRVEIFIGMSNNTRSAIRINGRDEVVNVSTPNILQAGRWNDFRVVWANFMVLVFRGNERFPFMIFNMDQFWPVAHYGIRALDNRAVWSIQPIGF